MKWSYCRKIWVTLCQYRTTYVSYTGNRERKLYLAENAYVTPWIILITMTAWLPWQPGDKNQGLFGKGLSDCINLLPLSDFVVFFKQDVAIFNSLPNFKILHLLKLKHFACDKINVTNKLKFDLKWVEIIVGKGENAGYQHFLLFQQRFQKAF